MQEYLIIMSLFIFIYSCYMETYVTLFGKIIVSDHIRCVLKMINSNNNWANFYFC